MSAAAVFYVLAVWAVGSALLVVTQRNAVASALWLVSTMFALSGIYVLLQAQFIGIIQILVYVGAVSILIVFAILLTRGGGAPEGRVATGTAQLRCRHAGEVGAPRGESYRPKGGPD